MSFRRPFDPESALDLEPESDRRWTKPPRLDALPDLLTKAEAASVLRMHPETLRRRYLATGKIPFLKLPNTPSGRVMVRREDLLEALERLAGGGP